MFVARNITGEPVTHRRALAFVNNVTALMGLPVLGLPVGTTNVKTIVLTWDLLAEATMELSQRPSDYRSAWHR
ncbi:MAG TPA: hypothetical protein VEI49_00910 [Terriglobales bacterium]|nr:hypothetical protein [Terriglobales bacterium]